MLKSCLVGLLLTIATVGIHAAGTAWWIRRLQRIGNSTSLGFGRLAGMKVLCSTATLLLLLHIVEVLVWALAYWALPGDQLNGDQLNTVEETVYFSMVTFTSLGYGDVVIATSWRLLSGIQAMAGLLIFGWSTALLFLVVRKVWESKETA